MTAILNLRGNKQMFTKAQITRQAKQREEIKAKILKAFGEDFIRQKQKELCTICRLRRAGGAVVKDYIRLIPTVMSVVTSA
ncbi:hypothetical protein [Dehalococcoides mccartyi]|uniref:hypothetical protein n=1 Tax=Dehalococcoides mccartyi TaxID=61435 RepID=UPI0006BDA1B3|nr:hypothetical protein [Dehalococcoides mccartyi]BAS31186.1 hypothetical protein IBK_0111 [Dehalococcoides mccartyi IBARAKI]